MTRPDELSAAKWITESKTTFDQLITFGPAVFEAYARLRFIADPIDVGQDEADVAVPDDHPSDLAQTRRALHRLAAFTETPSDCYFCVWEGYSDVDLPRLMETSMVVLPHRRYALFRGALSGIDTFARDFGVGRSIAPPAFVWPADHKWCFVSDVDPHWAGLGAGQVAVDALVADTELDVVPARPEDPQPRYY